jgi:hypothetical protein
MYKGTLVRLWNKLRSCQAWKVASLLAEPL